MREEHIEFSGPNREAWRKNGVGVFERLRNPLPGEGTYNLAAHPIGPDPNSPLK